MFSLQDFIKGGLMTAVGKMPDYQIILKSAEWFEKGVLTETDLADIQQAIDEHNTVEEVTEPETEETEQTETPEIEITESEE